MSADAPLGPPTMLELIAEVETLRARVAQTDASNEQLRWALAPFARVGALWLEKSPSMPLSERVYEIPKDAWETAVALAGVPQEPT